MKNFQILFYCTLDMLCKHVLDWSVCTLNLVFLKSGTCLCGNLPSMHWMSVYLKPILLSLWLLVCTKYVYCRVGECNLKKLFKNSAPSTS